MLVNPPDDMEAMLGVGKEFVQKYEPLGILYIAAALREEGHIVSIIDAYAEEIGTDDLMGRIETVMPDAVGFSTLTCHGRSVYSMGRELKQRHPDMLIVLGNIHASIFARQYLVNDCCDIVVHGEGEHVMVEILEQSSGDRKWEAVSGISFRGGSGDVVRTSPDNVIDDLSALPMPARDLVDQDLYGLSNISNQLFVAGGDARARTLITSRGCPYRCTFCVVHGDNKPRYNDAVSVVDEMEFLEKELGISYVYIQDPLFMGDRKRVSTICSEIKRRGLDLKWGCDTHVNYLKPRIIEELSSANCFELSVGIESGVQRLLDQIGKKTTLDRIVEATRAVKSHSDILLEGLFILGIPTETYEESLQTIRFAKSLVIDMAQFSTFMPYPGSPAFDDFAARGEIDTGIREDGGVDPDVWKRYSSYACFSEIEPIWVTPSLSVEQLIGLQKRALREFYLRPSQVWRQVKRIRPDNFFKMARIALRGFF